MRFKISDPQAIYELGQSGNQEDSIYPRLGEASTESRLFLVCDGIGGHEHGEVASKAVADAMSRYIREHFNSDDVVTDAMLCDALEKAYQELDILDSGGVRKMGTTLTLLCMHRGGLTVAHIGDSRIYHLRPTTGEILYISRDHSLVMDLFQAGEISREEMLTSPQKNVITRAMTPGVENRTKMDIVHITDVKPGDYFYLCSDGMLEQMTDSELLNIVADNTTDQEKFESLVSATANNKDNHSAYLIHVLEVVAESMDASQPNDEKTSKYNAVNIFKQYRAHDNEGVADDDDDVTVIPTPPPYQPRNNQSLNSDVMVISPVPRWKKVLGLLSLKWVMAVAILLLVVIVLWLVKFPKSDSGQTDVRSNCVVGTVGDHSANDLDSIIRCQFPATCDFLEKYKK